MDPWGLLPYYLFSHSFLLFTEGQLVSIPALACVSSEVLACMAETFLKTNKQTKPGVHFGWGRCFLHILSQAQKEPGLGVYKLFALHSGSCMCVCVCVRVRARAMCGMCFSHKMWVWLLARAYTVVSKRAPGFLCAFWSGQTCMTWMCLWVGEMCKWLRGSWHLSGEHLLYVWCWRKCLRRLTSIAFTTMK